jgi:hypothetical protein
MPTKPTNEWKLGFPPGKVTPEMLEKYEVYFSPIGVVWHRLKLSI